MTDRANHTSARAPWFKFFPADWQGDELLALCSLLARGLLTEFLCLMHKSTPCGHLLIQGRTPSDAELALLCHTNIPEMKRGRQELLDRGVLSITSDGTIYSRRMVRKAQQSVLRSDSGKLGAEARWKNHGPGDGKGDGNSYGNSHSKISLENNGPIASGTRILDPRSGEDPDLRARVRFDPDNPRDVLAAAFLEQYPRIYAKARAGSVYRTTNKHYERDLNYARELVAGWPDLGRLEAMLEVFLRRSDLGNSNAPGTPGQFLHMAPDCDAVLRAHGR